MQKYSLALLFTVGAALTAFSQAAKTSLLVSPIQYDRNEANLERALNKELRAMLVKAFVSHGRFSVVDRDFTTQIMAERELQKHEAFIDGKVVEQGRAVGAELLASGFYKADDGVLELRLVDVSNGQVVAQENASLRLPASEKAVRRLVYQLAGRFFGGDKIKLVRALEEKGDETRKVLLAGGSAKGLQAGAVLEVFYVETIEVDGETLERFVVAGKCKIDRVENANFSEARVKDGEKEIATLLRQGQKLYARILTLKP